MATFLPDTDLGLLAWALNFSTVGSSTPLLFGLTATEMTAFTGLYTSFATSMAAIEPGVRNKAAVATKNQARANLKNSARLLAKLVEGTGSVTNAQKLTLGLNVRAQPTPSPIPGFAPGLDVVSVSGYVAKIKMHDSSSSSRRGKPVGVSGASVFSHVGPTPPTDFGAWKFEGNTGRTIVDVVFPNTLAPGTLVWFTAFWFNGSKQQGPASTPVSTNLQGGSVSMAA